YIDIIFGHYISASAHTDCLNKLLKSILSGCCRVSGSDYSDLGYIGKGFAKITDGFIRFD
ncbi:hypothetical protein, partial [Moritella sp.]|uniref:hypothetical protein n=1 Tax=Moritella sp. TaxID=78556 RepID=UPI0025E17D36